MAYQFEVGNYNPELLGAVHRMIGLNRIDSSQANQFKKVSRANQVEEHRRINNDVFFTTTSDKLVEYLEGLGDEHVHFANTKFWGKPAKTIRIIENGDAFCNFLSNHWERPPDMNSDQIEKYLRGFLTASAIYVLEPHVTLQRWKERRRIVYITSSERRFDSLGKMSCIFGIPHLDTAYKMVGAYKEFKNFGKTVYSIWFYDPTTIESFVDESICNGGMKELPTYSLREAERIRDKFLEDLKKRKDIIPVEVSHHNTYEHKQDMKKNENVKIMDAAAYPQDMIYNF